MRRWHMFVLAALLAIGCGSKSDTGEQTDAGDASQGAQGSNDASEELPCPTDGQSCEEAYSDMAGHDFYKLVCAFGYCQPEPQSCVPGEACEDQQACIANLQSYCPECERTAGCAIPALCTEGKVKEADCTLPVAGDAGAAGEGDGSDSGEPHADAGVDDTDG